MVGVLRGAFMFMADLVRAIPREMTCDFLGVRSYGDATVSSGVVEITSDLAAPDRGRHVLLVEDIADTGLTLKYLVDLLQARGPAAVHTCALMAKPTLPASGGPPLDFVGFDAPDAFVVGYGLDAAQLYRNLPYMAALDAESRVRGGAVSATPYHALRARALAERLLLAAVQLFFEAVLDGVVALQELEVALAERLQVAALLALRAQRLADLAQRRRQLARARRSWRSCSSSRSRRPSSRRPGGRCGRAACRATSRASGALDFTVCTTMLPGRSGRSSLTITICGRSWETTSSASPPVSAARKLPARRPSVSTFASFSTRLRIVVDQHDADRVALVAGPSSARPEQRGPPGPAPLRATSRMRRRNSSCVSATSSSRLLRSAVALMSGRRLDARARAGRGRRRAP